MNKFYFHTISFNTFVCYVFRLKTNTDIFSQQHCKGVNSISKKPTYVGVMSKVQKAVILEEKT
jgi:hypothetical protein